MTGSTAYPSVTVTPLKGQPGVIDEIMTSDGTVHIERLDKHRYWCRIGESEFYFQSANPKKGPGVVISAQHNGRS